MSSSEAEQGLERGHRRLPTIVAKNELIQINLELITAHTVVSSEQPLLEVANRAVCQGHDGLRTLPQGDSQRLTASHVLESSFLQPSEALEPVGVYL